MTIHGSKYEIQRKDGKISEILQSEYYAHAAQKQAAKELLNDRDMY